MSRWVSPLCLAFSLHLNVLVAQPRLDQSWARVWTVRVNGATLPRVPAPVTPPGPLACKLFLHLTLVPSARSVGVCLRVFPLPSVSVFL